MYHLRGERVRGILRTLGINLDFPGRKGLYTVTGEVCMLVNTLPCPEIYQWSGKGQGLGGAPAPSASPITN